MNLEITNEEKELILMSLNFLFFDKGQTRCDAEKMLTLDKTNENTLNFIIKDLTDFMWKLRKLMDKIEGY